MPKVDFHIHTNLSDGVYSPEEVAKLAKDNNCHEIAITDHDNIADFTELAKTYDITIIPGIEFNTSVAGMHLLGYNIDNINLINDKMVSLKRENEKVCYQVIELMHNAGYDVSPNKIMEYLESINLDSTIMDKRKLVKYLIYKGYASNTLTAYKELIGKNQKFYVPNSKLTPKEVIDLVSEAKGITVLAHPRTLEIPIDELYRLINNLVMDGLKGIEIFNEKMLSSSCLYSDLADYFKLIKTVGSDFHNPNSDDIGIEIDDGLYQSISKKLIKKY